ncbi:MAG: hypothetical protein HC837_01095 [Chloroflexaceae bacterium]|nr:hypothetical protein [Chloroflexaceae bacterium]
MPSRPMLILILLLTGMLIACGRQSHTTATDTALPITRGETAGTATDDTTTSVPTAPTQAETIGVDPSDAAETSNTAIASEEDPPDADESSATATVTDEDATSTPTAEDDSSDQAIDPDSLVRYNHPSGVFSILIPDNWSVTHHKLTDVLTPEMQVGQPDLGNGLLTVFNAPDRFSAVSTTINPMPEASTLSVEEIQALMNNGIEEAFGREEDLEITNLGELPDGSVGSRFTFKIAVLDFAMTGVGFAQIDEPYFSSLWVLVPSDLALASEEAIMLIVNSYRVDSTVPLDTSDEQDHDERTTTPATTRTSTSDDAAKPAEPDSEDSEDSETDQESDE